MNIPSSFGLLIVCLLFVLNSHGTTTILVEGKSNVHIVYLGEKHHEDPGMVMESHHNLLASVVGSKQKASELIVYSYRHGFSGFAAKLTESEAQAVAQLPGVVKVIPNSLHKLQTTRSWDSLGLSSESHSSLLHKTAKGDGVIIAVFDTGIWPESKSFTDRGLGPIPSRWKGACRSGELFNATTNCNKKLIGARWFVDGFLAENNGQIPNSLGETEFMSPRDANGHGTHTASTAAGAFVRNVTYKGLASGTARGGAPNARLAVYKVCWTVFGLCASADILKAFDMAVHDGVDVISVSLGSSIPMYSNVDDRDGIAVGSFHAVANGITVVCAGGNSGPSDQTVTNVAPWILTVAANGVDRAFPSPITLGNNKTLMGQALYTGKEISFTGLFYPESTGRESFPPGDCDFLKLNKTSTRGKVVLCFTSSIQMPVIATAAFVVSKAGGVGLIVAKHQSGALTPCSDDFPCITVDYEVGTKILFYFRSTSAPLVKLGPSKTVVGKPVSPKVAFFSSIGPNSIAPAVLKPDISAPGVNILAATSQLDGSADNGYAIFSGTSMATPHVSGIVALLKALRPSWSPAAIRSALVTTASRTGPYGQPIFAEGSSMKLADPFDFGGGIVNPNAAADPGLVYDMEKSDYINYLCAMHFNNSTISHLTGNATHCPIRSPSVLDLNLPSITIPSLRTTPITVTRTVTNVGPPNSVYRAMIEAPSGISVSIRPNILVFDRRIKKRSFRVTMSTRSQVETGYLFGSLIWSNRNYAVRIPLSVRTEMFQPFGEEF